MRQKVKIIITVRACVSVCRRVYLCDAYESVTIMKTNVMVMKMLAMATTLWSAEMAMVMAVAEYDVRATLNM